MPQLTVTDIGAFACDSTEEVHNRQCPSGIEVRLGEQIDTIIYTGLFGEPIIHSIREVNGNRYLFTENRFGYQGGFTVGYYELYDLSKESFMRVALRRRLILYQEVFREKNGNYTHYVNKNMVDVSINDSIRFDINRYIMICPESETQCDTVHASYEYIDFALP